MKAVRDATSQYREESDTIGLYIDECLVNVPGAKTSLKEIHSSYEKWCDENGFSPMNSQNLARELRGNAIHVMKKPGYSANVLGYAIKGMNSEIPIEWLD